MIEDDLGYWWPADETGAGAAYRPTRIKNAKLIAAFVAQHVPIRRQCVQAGGHVGLWPKHLALLFEQVYTFEPDAANFSALMHNVVAPNVFAARGVLREYHGGVSMKRDKPESGVHYVAGTGVVPAYRIDDLMLDHADAIILDVEGSELSALWGAVDTIARCSPVIIVECLRGAEVLRDFMTKVGYGAGTHVLGYDYCFMRDRH